ncbi:MAG: large conductance mechanosensitive channel protein MscL [Myxococcota bacterium]
MWKDFKKFVTRGNLIDLAVAVVIGTAFAAVTKSLVDDVVMPPLALLTGDIDFANMFVLLQEGTPAGPYTTLADAKAAGAIAISYGNFITTIVNFLVVAAAMFGVLRVYQRMEKTFKKEEPTAAGPRKCPHCISEIADKATRCPHCTAELSLEDDAA